MAIILINSDVVHAIFRCVKLGDDPLSSLGQEKVISDREKAVAEYHVC